MAKSRSILGLFKETFREWQEDGALQLGAALAYYTVFSLAPILLLVIAIAGLVYGRDAVEGRLVEEIGGLVGPQGAEMIQTMIANVSQLGEGSGIAATVIGFLTILFGATGAFAQLQRALNQIWDVEPKPGQGVRGLLRTRAASFGMVLGIGFLLLSALVISAALSAIGAWAEGLLPGSELLVRAGNAVISFLVVALLFAMIFRVLPDVEIAWKDVAFGALATALLFVLGKFLIGLYLGRSAVASTFGAAGALVVLLLWIYYSAQILFFGAELTQVWARRHGERIEPSPHAVRVKEVKVREGEGSPPPEGGRGGTA